MNHSIEEDIIAYRRHFHRHPELGWLEYCTAAFIADELLNLGFEVKTGHEVMHVDNLMGLPAEQDNVIAFEKAEKIFGQEKMQTFANNSTAVAGILKCGDGPCVAIRVDMDALPITESNASDHFPNQAGFVSESRGVMHACGHDAHMAIGLGLAQYLAKYKDQLDGNYILLFQPAEEGVRGAASIVKSGFLKNVDYLLAAHMWSNMPLGKVVCSQNGTAATDKLDVTFYGKAVHAGICPEKGNNAILAAANTILALHEIQFIGEGLKRVNIGRMEGGTARNIIADRAKLEIELRADSQIGEFELLEKLEGIVKASAHKEGCSFEIKKVGEASAARGDDSLAKLISDEANNMNCFRDVILSDKTNRGSEDFTSLMIDVQTRGGKACFVGVGASPDKDLEHHTPDFDIAEAALNSTAVLFFNLIKRLKKEHL
ncbi:amidohydrolase [Ancylomarina euxinus]|uniref:Amidohydrolase n=1 Tax=Ancylomarina euxinus TaxID=2283627 RepID=A0A425XXQ9_9BACT|nr:amidohydrolase [Ancylomarina euxinus]MCZ4696002.1 amidohydrolase [Ancylomarina euxinus]MUP13943.1 amidohydrolase [Ancylomarina euxinus]RRG19499.1 amidohydrolase [Ancylomarina euxinus]